MFMCALKFDVSLDSLRKRASIYIKILYLDKNSGTMF